MEVDKYEYKGKLLEILTNISNASFITFDLEMSGINKSTPQQQEKHRTSSKPSLEENYGEMREAAEAYQILQVGICCVEEDREKGYYLARPYNFNLSPLEVDPIFPKFGLDRQFLFSGSSCRFLSMQRFDFGKVFESGVSYLSRPEEKEIRKSKIPGQIESRARIQLHPGEDKFEFYHCIKEKVIHGKATLKSESQLNIDHPDGPDSEFSNLQRKLIHQLVDDEFPGYKAFPGDKKCSWMKIVKFDQQCKDQKNFEEVIKFNTKIAKQIGLRWVIEALVNGNIDGIPTEWLYTYKTENPKHQEHEREIANHNLDKLKKKLKEKKHIIVGHNLFTDLGFLYATFIGPLPPSVTSFQQAIHKTFPFIMDTKYITSHHQNSMSMQRKLEDLRQEYKNIEIPKIYLHEDHATYNGMERAHEAGYDSWMTAELFAKFSLKLYNEAEFQDTGSDYETAYETAYEGSPELVLPVVLSLDPNTDLIDLSDEYGSTGSNPAEPHSSQLQNKYKYSDVATSSPEPSLAKPKTIITTQPEKFLLATDNPYAALALPSSSDDEPDEQKPPANKATKEKPTSKGVFGTNNNVGRKCIPIGRIKTAMNGNSGTKEERSVKKWLPGIENPFWELYANKLRVNAADTGVCDLASPQ